MSDETNINPDRLPVLGGVSDAPAGWQQIHQLYEKAVEQLQAQYERMVEMRQLFAEAARRNIELHTKILAEQTMMKKEMERLRQNLKRISTAR